MAATVALEGRLLGDSINTHLTQYTAELSKFLDGTYRALLWQTFNIGFVLTEAMMLTHSFSARSSL